MSLDPSDMNETGYLANKRAN